MKLLGDLLYGGAGGAPTRLTGDVSNTRKFLRELSAGGVAAAPAWDTVAVGDLPALNGLTAADVGLGDIFPEYGAAAAANRSLTINRIGGFLAPAAMMGGRLTLTTATWVTTADVTAALVLYFTPGGNVSGGHNRTIRSDGTRLTLATLTELSVKLTDSAQTGTMTNLSKIISGLTSTVGLVRAMKVSGASVGVGAIIATIDSATQVTVDVNSTGSTTNAVTFKLTSGTYDAFDVSGVLRLSNVWTTLTARADALGTLAGITVNNAAINGTDSNAIAAKAGVYLGTVYINATTGQTDDSYVGASQSGGLRSVWNMYNRVRRHIGVIEATDSWTYATATWRSTNNQTANRVQFVIGLNDTLVTARAILQLAGGASIYATTGIGLDVTNANSAQFKAEGGGVASNNSFAEAVYTGYPGIGYHALNWLDYVRTGGTQTFYGDGGTVTIQSGLYAEVWC